MEHKPRFTDQRLAAVACALSRIPAETRMDTARQSADAAGIQGNWLDELLSQDFNLTASGNVLVLDGPIYPGAFGRLRELLTEYDEDAELRLDIHSPGGDAVEAVAMLNDLLEDGRVKQTRVLGEAFSAASYLFLAADDRRMELGAVVGVHDAWGITIGNARDMRESANMLDVVSRSIAAVYANRCGGTAAEWRALMAETTMLDAPMAVELNMATSMAEGASDSQDADEPPVEPATGRSDPPSSHLIMTYATV